MKFYFSSRNIFFGIFIATLHMPAPAQEEIETPLSGGWSLPRPDDNQVFEATSFCMQALHSGDADLQRKTPNYSFTTTTSSSGKVVRALQQVVAGLNFQLTILVYDESSPSTTSVLPSGFECKGAFTATVYNHFGDLSITKWGQEVPCREAMALLQDNERAQ